MNASSDFSSHFCSFQTKTSPSMASIEIGLTISATVSANGAGFCDGPPPMLQAYFSYQSSCILDVAIFPIRLGEIFGLPCADLSFQRFGFKGDFLFFLFFVFFALALDPTCQTVLPFLAQLLQNGLFYTCSLSCHMTTGTNDKVICVSAKHRI